MQIAESATLWTLLATVTLFTAGAISHEYTLDALGIRGLRQDIQWQDRVFQGGLAVVNMTLEALTEPRLKQLWWLLTLAVFAACLWGRRKSARPRLRVALGVLAACAYLATILLIGVFWGQNVAEFVRARKGHDRFVFSPDVVARLPAALVHDNDAAALRVVASTADFLVVLSADGNTVWRIANRDVDVQESLRQ